MYIPKLNNMTDRQEALAFIRRFSFATIITARDNIPQATHLPFLIEERNGELRLKSQFARANRQWQDIEENQCLVIFSEPHAYISPSNYEKEQNVPTWNYLAVHAYGEGKLITDSSQVMRLLEQTIDQYETAYRAQFDKLSDDYKSKMARGIVAFEIIVTELEGKKKLSQNKTETERDNVIKSLAQSPNTAEQLIAEYMMREK